MFYKDKTKARRLCQVSGCKIPADTKCLYYWGSGYGGKRKINICPKCIDKVIKELTGIKEDIKDGHG